MITTLVILFIFSARSTRSNAGFLVTPLRRRSPVAADCIFCSVGTIVRGRALDQCEMDEHEVIVLDDPTHNIVVGRRRLIHSFIISSAYKSIASHATEYKYNSAVLSKNKQQTTHSAICDPTVESYRKGSNSIHIVGTAHISSVSSRLSRDTVKETKV